MVQVYKQERPRILRGVTGGGGGGGAVFGAGAGAGAGAAAPGSSGVKQKRGTKSKSKAAPASVERTRKSSRTKTKRSATQSTNKATTKRKGKGKGAAQTKLGGNRRGSLSSLIGGSSTSGSSGAAGGAGGVGGAGSADSGGVGGGSTVPCPVKSGSKTDHAQTTTPSPIATTTTPKKKKKKNNVAPADVEVIEDSSTDENPDDTPHANDAVPSIRPFTQSKSDVTDETEAANVHSRNNGSTQQEQAQEQAQQGKRAMEIRPVSAQPAVRRRKPMPKVHYQSLKLTQLKTLLRDNFLPTTGKEKKLQERHKELVQLYNSESDALEPKSLRQCADVVMQRERLNGTDTGASAQADSKVAAALSKLTTKSPPEEIRAAQLAYLRQYRGHFAEIRKQARVHTAVAAANAAAAAAQATPPVAAAAAANSAGGGGGTKTKARTKAAAAAAAAASPSPSVRRSPSRTAKTAAAGKAAEAATAAAAAADGEMGDMEEEASQLLLEDDGEDEDDAAKEGGDAEDQDSQVEEVSSSPVF
eukprot:gene455-28712_t